MNKLIKMDGKAFVLECYKCKNQYYSMMRNDDHGKCYYDGLDSK